MIFCVGRTSSYERGFEEEFANYKLGRNDPDAGEGYPGGSVWQTVEEAQKHCPDEFSVYGVVADWETQTVPNLTLPWHDLLETSLLVKL